MALTTFYFDIIHKASQRTHAHSLPTETR